MSTTEPMNGINDREPPANGCPSEESIRPEAGPVPPDDWKRLLRRDFEDCLHSLEAFGESAGEEGSVPPETPDLYSFYVLWAASQAETRKANRRMVEALGQWNEIASRVESDMRLLRESQSEKAELDSAGRPPGEPDADHALCLSLVELSDRLQRVLGAFDDPPPETWWGRFGRRRRNQAWETQRKALEILAVHLEALLQGQGITRMVTVGQIFDPSSMIAVDTDRKDHLAHRMVLEESLAGFYRRGKLLRPAQVIVNHNQ